MHPIERGTDHACRFMNKKSPSPSKSSTLPHSIASKLVWASLSTLVFGLTSPLLGQNWTGAIDPTWNTGGNWSTNTVPTSSQVANFNAVVTHNNMVMEASMTLDGLNFGAGATQDFTLEALNDDVLTLDGGAGTDINVAAGSGAHTLLSTLNLTNSHSWSNASSNVFTVGGDINLGTTLLTLGSQGSGGWVLGGVNTYLTNTSNNNTVIAVGNTEASTDLTLNGTINISNSAAARIFRIAPAAESVVNIDAVIANSTGITNPTNSSVTIGHTTGSTGTVNLNRTKTYTGTTTINMGATLNVNAAITNIGNWDIDGSTLNWNVTNTAMGGLFLGGGLANSVSQLNIANGVIMNLGGNVIAESNVGHSNTSHISGGILQLNGNRNFEARPSNNTDKELIIHSSIGDGSTASGITKTRNGVIVLAGANTFTGATTINEGGIILDYSENNGNKLSTSAALTFGGGHLWLYGNANAASSQAVDNTVLNGLGANQLKLTAGAGQSLTFEAGAISRANNAGNTIDFHLIGETAKVLTSTSNTQNGILGGWATTTNTTGTYFSTVVGNEVQALMSENFALLNSQREDQVGQWQAGANVQDEAGFTGASNSMDINSLRIAGSSDLEVKDLLILQSGGLLIDSSSSSTGIHGGTLALTSAANNFELKIHQNSTNSFEISSNIQRLDNSAVGHVDLTKSGIGELVLSGNNLTSNRSASEANGTIRLNEGTLVLKGGNAIGDRSSVTIDHRAGVTLQLLDDETIGNLNGGGLDGGVVNIGNHTLTVQVSSTQSFNGTFIGSGTIIKQSRSPGALHSTWNISGNTSSLFTGHIVGNGGLVQLSGSTYSNFSKATGLTFHRNSGLLLDGNGSTTSLGDKVNDAASITLNGANGAFTSQIAFRGLHLRSDQPTLREEIFGELILNSGASYSLIESSHASNSNNVTYLSASSITRNNQSTLSVRGTNLGASSGKRAGLRISGSQESNFLAQHLSGGNGSAESSTLSIVRWAIAENLVNSILTNQTPTTPIPTQINLQLGNSLATYVEGAGFRALDFTNEYTTFASATSEGIHNVRESLNSDRTNVQSQNMNALVLNNSSTSEKSVLGAGTNTSLNLQSGTLLFTALQSNGSALPTVTNADIASGNVARGITLGGFDQGITTGSGEYVIFQNNLASAGVRIDSDLTSAATLTKSGIGTLILNGNNSAITDVVLNEGTVQISNLDNLGGTDGNLTFAGGTLQLASTFTGNLGSKNLVVIGETYQAGNNGGRSGTLNTNGVNLTLTNNISGSGEFVKTGGGTLTLASSTETAHLGNFVVEQHSHGGAQNGNIPQLILNNTGGNAIGGNLQIGAYITPTPTGSASVNLARSEQIADHAVISFNGGSNKNAYFSLKGFNETVAGLRDISGTGITQIDQTGGSGNSTLTLAGSEDYYFNGYVRQRSGGSGGVLSLIHSGSGRQTLVGSNINYSGLTTNSAGSLQYRDTINFDGSIANSALIEFERTNASEWNYSGVISGSGDFVKTGTGTGITTLDNQNTMTGSVVVKTGTLGLGSAGSIQEAALLDIYTNATFSSAANTASVHHGRVSGTGTLSGNFILTKGAQSTAELRPGASTESRVKAAGGNLLGELSVNGNLTLTGGSAVGDGTGATATFQVSRATLNDASGIRTAMDAGDLSTYLNARAAAVWNEASTVDSVSGRTAHDTLKLTGTLTWDAGSTISVETVDGYQFVYGDVIDLFDWGNLLSGTADTGALQDRRDGGLIADLYLPTLLGELEYDLSAFHTHGLIAVIPEPTRALSIAFGILLLGLQRRRPKTH